MEIANGDDNDWWSALPLDIKLKILSLLDVKSLMSMSAVSRECQSLLKLLPGVNLDFLNRPKKMKSNRWVKILGGFLNHIEAPIRRVHLIDDSQSIQHVYIQQLLELIALKGGLETLIIYNSIVPRILCLPVLTTLTRLELIMIDVSLPPGFTGFPHLTRLRLFMVDINKSDLQLLVNGSGKIMSFEASLTPRETLSLGLCLPSAKFLFLELSEFLDIWIISAPYLERAHVMVFPSVDLAPVARSAKKLISDMHEVSTLTIDSEVIRAINRRATHESDEITQGVCLRELMGICCIEEGLKVFKISMTWLSMCDVFPIIVFILTKAKVLKQVEVSYSVSAGIESELVKKLRQLNPASSVVKVLVVPCGGQSQVINLVKEKVRVTAQEMGEEARETVHDSWESAKEMADEANNRAADMAEQTAESVKTNADKV